MTAGVTSTQIEKALAKRYSGDDFYFIPQCKNGPSGVISGSLLIFDGIAIAKKREHDHKDGDDCPSMDKYVDSVYDCALKLAKEFDKQNHSGMSAGLSAMLFRKLVAWKPLSPINGTEDEWHSEANFEDQPGNLHQQNRRCSSVFRDRKSVDDPWHYKYIDIIDILNTDDVWKTYPPVDDPGTLDDNDPKVKGYFEKIHALRDKHNAEITFPYSPFTFKYRWNFTTEEFEAVE